MLRVIGVALGGLAVAGCALLTTPAPPRVLQGSASAEARSCLTLVEELDRVTHVAGVRDASAYRIEGYPFLRSDRLLAGLGARLSAEAAAGSAGAGASASGSTASAAFITWVDRLRETDTDARRIEVANLDESAFPILRNLSRPEVDAQLDACGRLLAEVVVRDPALRTDLLKRAGVPDDYSTLRRALGLYPITGIGYASSVRNWQDHARNVFLQQRRAPGNGQIALQQYKPSRAPASTAAALDIARRAMAAAQVDALGIPRFSNADLERLFLAFAPTLVVATGADSDRIGALQWIDLKGLVEAGADPIWLDVDTSRPTVYRRLAYTRIDGVVLPQLVYEMWFGERPMLEVGDLHGGRLDSLIWRVTLDETGQPLMFDTIHGSGRFSMEFPTSRMRPRARPDGESLIDWVFVPIDQPVERWVGAASVASLSLFVSSQTHQIVGLGQPDASWGEPQVPNPDYQLVPGERLQRLPLPESGSRSIFNADGILPGSERLGRYFFWPMGVANAGAMRQWGRQPTALIGRRHFDDIDVIDRRFERLR